jgi:hypothetical protein
MPKDAPAASGNYSNVHQSQADVHDSETDGILQPSLSVGLGVSNIYLENGYNYGPEEAGHPTMRSHRGGLGVGNLTFQRHEPFLNPYLEQAISHRPTPGIEVCLCYISTSSHTSMTDTVMPRNFLGLTVVIDISRI